MSTPSPNVFAFTVPSIADPSGTDGAIAELGLCTDIDASLRFAGANAETLRYCPGIGWLFWDGRRWKPDGEGRAIELSKESARKTTLKWMKSDSLDRAKAALSFESSAHVRAAVDLAKSDQRLVVDVSELDRDPWSLNVTNGTLDLRTGKLRAHRREDLCTKLAPVHFDPNATHPILTHFLANCDDATPGMSLFLARSFGAALTGNAECETLFLLQGDAGSGKTTLVEAGAAMLGDYAVKLLFESFCLSKSGRQPGAASPDLVPLRGSRLAYAVEGDQSARLDAGVVKMLTGNEPITARALYSPPITFLQTWKLWLVSNFDPKADSEDGGIWRRMLKLQFTAIPKPQRDPSVKRTLTTDPAARSALLAWAMAGCLDWQARGGGRDGLAPPDPVQAATDAYRVKQDTMAEWWEDLLTDASLFPNAFTPIADLRDHYEKWCEDEGATPVLARRFNSYLESKGLAKKRGTGGVKGWSGIKLESK